MLQDQFGWTDTHANEALKVVVDRETDVGGKLHHTPPLSPTQQHHMFFTRVIAVVLMGFA